jgi:hypothetical protein
MRRFHTLLAASLCIVLIPLLAGCPSRPHAQQRGNAADEPSHATARGAAKIRGVRLDDPVRPVVDAEPIVVAAARNEWTSFAVQIDSLPQPARKRTFSFRLHAPRLRDRNGVISIEHFSAAQILPMPVDVNRAGFVRHTGLSAAVQKLPRALMPVTMDRGVVNLSAVRNPDDPFNPGARPSGPSGEPLRFWIDLHVPPDADPGEYATTVDLLGSDSPLPLARVPVKLTVYDFVLRDERDLVMTSRIRWEDLKRLYPAQFETITPRLIHRGDPQYAATVQVLDSLVKLAAAHRTELVIPRLQPTVKWPAGRPPQIDWRELDSLLSPWLSGEAFADRIPLTYWPLPAADYLDNYDRKSQLEYWTAAATHFDQQGWLARSAAQLDLPVAGRVSGAQAIQMSADAAEILSAHPKVRVALPLEEDQLQLATQDNPRFIDPKSTDRLLAAGPGIVFNTPIQKWPTNIRRPARWLRTDVPGLVQYVGAGGDERDVRTWAWLAFLRQANLIQWGSPLPRTSSPTEPADPSDLVWFYPGEWFGVDRPEPTVQLKWVRRAQQDFQYLWLARQRGETINALLMARLMSRPVEIQPNQAPDPTYVLMTGTTDESAWTEGQKLLAKIILLREPGETKDEAKANELNLQLLRWIAPQDQAMLMARAAEWGFSADRRELVHLRLGLDIYNASDTRPEQNRLRWSVVPRPSGWVVRPQPLTIPALSTYRVERFPVEASFDLNNIDADNTRPFEMTFINGDNNHESKFHFVLPVAASDRHAPGLKIDGKLDDWEPAERIQDGPLVRMFNRPALQKQELQLAQNPAKVFSGWADENFYVAFELSGASAAPVMQSRNFVDYQFRRAWGEDLCEVLIQPVFDDNRVGPVLHVVCKPAGHWIERKHDPRLYTNPWQPFEGAAVRYAATSDGTRWRGEVAIPWKAITNRDGARPRLLRFNFAQHVHSTGESATWAGPVDFGRDDAFMGLIYIRDLESTGVARP